MSSTTITASRILNKLQIDEPTIDVLSESALHMIKKNMSNDALAEYSDDINVLIEIYRNYQAKKEKPRFPEDKIKIVYSLLRFIANPFEFINAKNFMNIETNDPTHSYLQKEVIKLGLAYIRQNIIEYKANRQHLKSNKRRNGELVY